MKYTIVVDILIVVLIIGLGSTVSGTIHSITGGPFLYQAFPYPVDPNAPAKNGPAYQAQYGYRGVHFLENINQKSVESNPSLYDPKYVKNS